MVVVEFLALEDGGCFGELVSQSGSFVEEGAGVFFTESGGEEGGFGDGRYGASGEDHRAAGGMRRFEQDFFGAEGLDFYVGEAEFGDCGFDEAYFLPTDSERMNCTSGRTMARGIPGKPAPGAGVEDVSGAGEELPGEDGVQHVFDDGLTRGGDAGEVEAAVGFDDSFEVKGTLIDEFRAPRYVVRKKAGEFPAKFIYFMMSLDSA